MGVGVGTCVCMYASVIGVYVFVHVCVVWCVFMCKKCKCRMIGQSMIVMQV